MTSLGPKIDNFKGEKQKPTYLNVIEDTNTEQDDYDDEEAAGDADLQKTEESAVFYVYTGVGN